MVAGNEVGITGARQCAVPLGSAHLCAGFICGNTGMPWWRGMWMHFWGSRGRRFKSGRPDGFSNTCTPKWERKHHDHSHRTGRHEHTIQANGQAIPMTRAPMAEIPARRAG